MQKKQATGLDTRAMLPIFSCVFIGAASLVLPCFSIPSLKQGRFPTTYTIWQITDCVKNILQNLDKVRFTDGEVEGIYYFMTAFQIMAILTAVLMGTAIFMAYRKRQKSIPYMRMSFAFASLLPIVLFVGVMFGNWILNIKMGVVNDFFHLTAGSYMQLTSFLYAQFILSIGMCVGVKRLLNIEDENPVYIERRVRTDKKMGKRTKISILLILFVIPFLIFFGIFFLNDRSESFIALCIIGASMIPFAMVFEDRKPQARELLLIAVMAGIAVVGRMAFFMLPQFKPVSAIVIITGISLGAEAGFLTGAVAGFVSNFFFGQGPWTPWQMFAFGIIGFLAGILFRGKREKYGQNRFLLCCYGGIATLVIYGVLMDTSSVTMFLGNFNWKAFLAVYVSGFPFNVLHGISTVVFLFFLAKPMERKLERIKKKYGILEQ